MSATEWPALIVDQFDRLNAKLDRLEARMASLEADYREHLGRQKEREARAIPWEKIVSLLLVAVICWGAALLLKIVLLHAPEVLKVVFTR